MFEEHQKKFLSDIQKSNVLLLVEGKKDYEALKKAGIDNIFEISGRQLEKIADLIKTTCTRVAVLTDFDGEGIKQYKRLKKLLLSNEVKIDDDIRRKFKHIFHVNKIEELNGYFK
ncbi:MAG: toprim domain-containing protein [Candidatus Aenigmatarchaeota archaeon]